MVQRVFAWLIRAALVAAALPAFAQSSYPAKPLRLIVGFTAGGSADTTARIIAKRMSDQIGQPVVIENRAGAGGVLAMDAVAKAPGDGYTIHLASNGPLVVNPHAQPNLPYDVRRDIAPLSMAVIFGNVIVVHPSMAATSLEDYLAAARTKPGGVRYASPGIGTAGHLAGELLRRRAQVELTHVAYRGGAPAMTDLLGGQVESMIATPATSLPHIKSGKVRAIAVTGAKRAESLPNVPTIAELGYAGFDVTNWYVFVTNTRVPNDIQARLNGIIQAAVRAPDVREQLAVHGQEAWVTTIDETTRYIERESALWARVVKDAGIRLE